MKIYTKTGDSGETGLYSGLRVPKNHPLIEAYGTVDELNALIGIIRSEGPTPDLDEKLLRIQNELFYAGSDLATPIDSAKSISRMTSHDAQRLEKEIDEAEKRLPALTQFILPGGCKTSSWLHLGRTICRRAERLIVLAQKSHSTNPEVLIYFNRLSDWMFVMARLENSGRGISDIPWKKTE